MGVVATEEKTAMTWDTRLVILNEFEMKVVVEVYW